MEWNLSLVISVCAFILAILSPVASALIAGHYRIKEKQLDYDAAREKVRDEIYTRHKREVIEEYIREAGKVTLDPTGDAFAKYGLISNQIYLYVSSKHWELLDGINDSISKHEYDCARRDLAALCRILSKEGIGSPDDPEPNSTEDRVVK